MPRLLLTSLLLLGPATGQLVTPASALAIDANSVGEFAGFDRKLAQQVLIHERVLRTIAGKTIRSISVRRNDALGTSYRAGRSRIELWATPTSTGPAHASTGFAQNRGNPVRRFQGSLALPASSPISGRPTWTAAHAVKIPFQTPMPYRSGDHVCIDVRGEPTTARSDYAWPVDYDHHSNLGSWTTIGQGCGIPRADFSETLVTSARGLIAGGSLLLTARGLPGTPGVAMIGGTTHGQGLPLDTLGMRSCRLYVSPAIQVTFLHPASTTTTNAATARIQIPSGPSAVGGRLFAQVANLETGSTRSNAAGITTTNALDLRISATLPNPSVTTIEPEPIQPTDPWPTQGDVLIGRGPVFGFEAN